MIKKSVLFIFLTVSVIFAAGTYDYSIVEFPFLGKTDSSIVQIKFMYTEYFTPPITPSIPAGPSEEVVIYYSREPGGANPDNYTDSITVFVETPEGEPDSADIDTLAVIDTGSSGGVSGESSTADLDGTEVMTTTLNFVPAMQTKKIGVGLYYYIVKSKENDFQSDEMQFIVESRTPPAFESPENQAEISTATPEFQWTTVPNVPYYHLLVSDQEIEINADSGTFKNASFIWQIITPAGLSSITSVIYGQDDPTGMFPQAPPLSPGQDYEWIVLNNYTGDQLGSSTNAINLVPPKYKFTIEAESKLYSPFGLSPNDGNLSDTIKSSESSNITFSWRDSSSSDDLNSYQFYIYEYAEVEVSEDTSNTIDAKVTVFNSSTIDTTITIDAVSVLKTGTYYWKVFAMDAEGFSVASDTAKFYFQSTTGEFSFSTKEILNISGSDTLLAKTPFVNIEATPLEGTSDRIPIKTSDKGAISKDLLAGSYSFRAYKDGYIDQIKTDSVESDENTQVTFILEKAPSTIYGKVVDNSSESSPVSGAEVFASSDLEDTVITTTKSDGTFKVTAYEADWTLTIKKTGYLSAITDGFSVSAGENKSLDDNIVLIENPYKISGTVKSDNGSGINRVEVKLYNRSGILKQKAYTNNEGVYSLDVSNGIYSVDINKFGYEASSSEITVAGENVSRDVTLSSETGEVRGVITIKTVKSDGSDIYAPAKEKLVSFISGLDSSTAKKTTDITGNYSKTLASGSTTRDYTLSFSGDGFEDYSRDFTVTKGEAVVIADTINRYASVSGTVTDTASNILSGISVSLIDTLSGDVKYSGSSTPQGNYNFNSVKNGVYRLAAGGKGFFPSPDSSEIILTIEDFSSKARNVYLVEGAKTLVAVFQTEEDFSEKTLKLKSPVNRSVKDSAGDAGEIIVDSLGSGEYLSSYTAVREADSDSLLLDIQKHVFQISASDDTTRDTVKLDIFLITEDTLALLSGDSVEVSFTVKEVASSVDSLDSAKIYFKFYPEAPYDSVSYVPSSGRISEGSVRFFPGNSGTEIYYYIKAYRNNDVYSNKNSFARSYIEPTQNLKYITLSPSGMIDLPKNFNFKVNVSAKNGNFKNISNPSITWDIDDSGLFNYSAPSNSYTCSISTSNSGDADSVFTIRVEVAKGGVTLYDSIQIRIRDVSIKTFSFPGVKTDPNGALWQVDHRDSVLDLSLKGTGSQGSGGNEVSFTVYPEWSCEPAEACANYNEFKSTGKFKLNADRSSGKYWLGSVRIFAKINGKTVEANKKKDEEKLMYQNGMKVQYIRNSGITDTVVLFNGDNMELQIDQNFSTRKIFSMEKPTDLNSSQISAETQEIVSEVFDIESELEDDETVKLRIKPDITMSNAMSVVYLNKFGEWIEEETRKNGGFLEAELDHFSRFAVAEKSEELGYSEFKIVPNPFSPYVTATRDGNTKKGMRIHFKPEGMTNKPTVSIKIYNMYGEFVRSILDGDALPKIAQDFYWDGLTEGGKMARNGRYVLKFSITDGEETKEKLYKIVLFK
ncbi:MAG: carboxypeptidase regulatory-like domain-containing protein [Fibrobacterota bacterium]